MGPATEAVATTEGTEVPAFQNSDTEDSRFTLSPEMLKIIRRMTGGNTRSRTKKYITKARRKSRRKIQKLSRRRNRT